MGLFDTVRCEYRLPNPAHQDLEFQTKDLDRLLDIADVQIEVLPRGAARQKRDTFYHALLETGGFQPNRVLSKRQARHSVFHIGAGLRLCLDSSAFVGNDDGGAGYGRAG